MSTWDTFYVVGNEPALTAWLNNKKIAFKSKSYLPNDIQVTDPIYPQQPDGTTNVFGLPNYERKGGNPQAMWLFGLHGDKQALLDEIKVLNGPYTVYETESIEDIRVLYPEYTLGQAIPWFS